MEGRTLRAGTRKAYAGLDEGTAIIEDEDEPPKKRGRPPGSAKKEQQPKKRGRPATAQPRGTGIQPPACGELRLAQWREQLEALPDDTVLHAAAARTAPTHIPTGGRSTR